MLIDNRENPDFEEENNFRVQRDHSRAEVQEDSVECGVVVVVNSLIFFLIMNENYQMTLKSSKKATRRVRIRHSSRCCFQSLEEPFQNSTLLLEQLRKKTKLFSDKSKETKLRPKRRRRKKEKEGERRSSTRQ